MFANFSAYMHDPNVYEDPDVFQPERFIRNGKLDFSIAPDPAKFIFGFGRRYETDVTRTSPSMLTSDILICGVVLHLQDLPRPTFRDERAVHQRRFGFARLQHNSPGRCERPSNQY